jgi:hypothetical protein
MQKKSSGGFKALTSRSSYSDDPRDPERYLWGKKEKRMGNIEDLEENLTKNHHSPRRKKL